MQGRKLKRKKMMEELTRQDILDSTVAVLLESGIDGFTMDDVALKAGIAKGTVYLYFKNKQALLDSVVYHSFVPLEKELEGIIKSDIHPLSKLEQCALVSLKYTENNNSLLNELRSVMFNTIDQDISDKKSWYWTVVNFFKVTLEEGVKKEVFDL